MGAIKTEAIILKKINYRETSVLLDLFTLKVGKIRGILKGVRDEKSKIPPISLSPGAHILTFIYPKHHLNLTLTTSPSILNYFEISKKENLKVWYLILNLVNMFTPEKEKSDEIFKLLLQTGNFLTLNSLSTIIFVGFKIKFIKILGYGIELNKCISCREEDTVYFFSGKLGGIICRKCKEKDLNSSKISNIIVSIMRYLEKIPFEKLTVVKKIPKAILKKINFYLNLTLYYHTDSKVIWWENEKNLF